MVVPSRPRAARAARRVRGLGAAAGVLAAACLGACGSSSDDASPSKQVPAGAKQEIVFAVQGGTSGGLGSEGANTAKEIKAFEAANPNIKVKVLPLASATDQAYQQVTQRFIAKSATPDVINSDDTWAAGFGQAGWIAPLDQFNPPTDRFFPGSVAGGTYKGKLYHVPWFFNVEGLYYRKDLIPSVPASPEEVVQAAIAAKAKDPSIKYGLAFEGSKYEGAVTVLMGLAGGYGGKFDPAAIDTPQNEQALQFLHDAIYKHKISPTAVTGWTESEVGDAFTSGQAAFATNWPYILQIAEGKDSKVKGKTGFIPFPPSGGGKPTTTLGDQVLSINARSTHQAAAWKFINFLLDAKNQRTRAIEAGDPPSVQDAYTDALYQQAPYYRDMRKVFPTAQPRPVNPHYQQISQAVQTAISSVLANQKSPKDALKQAKDQVASLPGA
jgi:multiple sugar transport system substrate-binding protein